MDTDDVIPPYRFEKQLAKIEEAFYAYGPVIADERRAIIDKYRGISLLKSPEELREALKSIN